MKDTTDWNDIEILPRSLGLTDATEDRRERRELIIMRTGTRKIGLFADEADSVTDNLRPTPIPHAPVAVLGVVSVRGRMCIVLDPLALLDAGNSFQPSSVQESQTQPSPRRADDAPQSRTGASIHTRYIVALRGDEQLALAVEQVERIVEVLTENIQPLKHAASVVRGVIQQDSSNVVLLDPSRLFEAATQGTERRRKR